MPIPVVCVKLWFIRISTLNSNLLRVLKLKFGKGNITVRGVWNSVAWRSLQFCFRTALLCFSEKAPRAASMSNRANLSWLQKGPGWPKLSPLTMLGGTSVITCLRNGLKPLCSICEREGWERYEGNSSGDTKVSNGGGEWDGPDTEAEIPLQPLEKTMVKQVVPLQLMEDHVWIYIYIETHGRHHTRAGRYAVKEAAWTAHTRAGSWQNNKEKKKLLEFILYHIHYWTIRSWWFCSIVST